jgi:hypothetical protein
VKARLHRPARRIDDLVPGGVPLSIEATVKRKITGSLNRTLKETKHHFAGKSAHALVTFPRRADL